MKLTVVFSFSFGLGFSIVFQMGVRLIKHFQRIARKKQMNVRDWQLERARAQRQLSESLGPEIIHRWNIIEFTGIDYGFELINLNLVF